MLIGRFSVFCQFSYLRFIESALEFRVEFMYKVLFIFQWGIFMRFTDMFQDREVRDYVLNEIRRRYVLGFSIDDED